MKNKITELKETIKSRDKEKCKKIVSYAIIVILLIVIIILLLRSCGKSNKSSAEYSETYFDVTQDANIKEGEFAKQSKEEIEAKLNKQVEDGLITISMNLNPYFADGKSEGNLLIYNDTKNKYPQIIEIYLKDSNECVYRSGLIPVGSNLESAKLDKELRAGQYPAVAYFNAIEPTTGKLIGKAGAEIEIIIGS